MKGLILFRHAKTERRSASGEDFDRELTDRGREDAALVGSALAGAGLAPDLVLLSPAARARQTWEIVQPRFPAAAVVEKSALYSADAADVLRLAQGRSEARVMVIGHNPSMHVLACDLLEGRGGSDADRVRDGFPTAAAAAFDLAGGTPRLLALFVPSALGGGGGGDD